MAALDFGMALARGLVAPHAGYQETVKSAAGGVGIFKSEDWWNKQLDQGIKQGFNETVTSRVAPNTFQGRNGFNQKMVTQKGYDSATPVYEEYYRRRGRAGGLEKLPINTPNVDRRFYLPYKKLIGYDAVKNVPGVRQETYETPRERLNLNSYGSLQLKKGGTVKKKTVSKPKTSSASKRGDGCITKGKTKGKMV